MAYPAVTGKGEGLKRDHSVGRFRVSTDKSRLDLKAVHGFLKDAYWAKDSFI
jgi:hypothetical protein